MSLRRPRVLCAAWRTRARTDPALGWALGVAAEAERRLARSRQEMEGWRRQEGRRRRDAEAKGRLDAAQAFLAGLDALDTALDGPDPPEGLEMVRAGLLQGLKELGGEDVPGAGEPVDPADHEVVAGEGKVVGRVLRRGLRLGGRLVRAAMVEARE